MATTNRYSVDDPVKYEPARNVNEGLRNPLLPGGAVRTSANPFAGMNTGDLLRQFLYFQNFSPYGGGLDRLLSYALPQQNPVLDFLSQFLPARTNTPTTPAVSGPQANAFARFQQESAPPPPPEPQGYPVFVPEGQTVEEIIRNMVEGQKRVPSRAGMRFTGRNEAIGSGMDPAIIRRIYGTRGDWTDEDYLRLQGRPGTWYSAYQLPSDSWEMGNIAAAPPRSSSYVPTERPPGKVEWGRVAAPGFPQTYSPRERPPERRETGGFSDLGRYATYGSMAPGVPSSSDMLRGTVYRPPLSSGSGFGYGAPSEFEGSPFLSAPPGSQYGGPLRTDSMYAPSRAAGLQRFYTRPRPAYR